MGIFDFLKKAKKEFEKQKVSFSELGEWISKEEEKNKENEKIALKKLFIILNEVVLELGDKNNFLKDVNLNERKENEKLKLIVIENLSNYSHYISRLVENIKKIEAEKPSGFSEVVKILNSAILDFKQKSAQSFEKATILVGKELSSIKEILTGFYKQLDEFFLENKELVTSLEVTRQVKGRISEIKSIEKEKISVLDELKQIETKSKTFSEELEITKNKIQEIKSSNDYLELEKEKDKLNLMKTELNREILQLRNIINFKSLTKLFHSNPKKMEILNEYDKDFNQILEKDGTTKFLELIDDSKKSSVLIKIGEINDRRRKINELFSRKDPLETFSLKLLNLATELKNLESWKIKASKRFNDINEKLINLKNSIKEEILVLNVVLGD
jgi:hypothetical protein